MKKRRKQAQIPEINNTSSLTTSTTWSSELPIYHQCPYKNNNNIVLVELSILTLCRRLDNKYRDYEFLIYATADNVDDFIIVRPPVYLPRQEVTASSVNVKDTSNINNYDAVIHKHPSGLREFSATDDEYINANNLVSILYVDNEFAKAVIRRRMPCGIYMLIDAKVLLYYDRQYHLTNDDISRIVNEADKKIEKPKHYQRLHEYDHYDYYYYYQRHDDNDKPWWKRW